MMERKIARAGRPRITPAAAGDNIPVPILSARDEEIEQVTGLEVGADLLCLLLRAEEDGS
jgi:DNA-binding response OmpR family regulator